MSDYIKREDAVEVLSHPVAMSMCLTKDEVFAKRAQRDIDIALIRELPSADVVEVVRCKDCKFYSTFQGFQGIEHPVCTYQVGGKYVRKRDDFCSRGERRNT